MERAAKLAAQLQAAPAAGAADRANDVVIVCAVRTAIGKAGKGAWRRVIRRACVLRVCPRAGDDARWALTRVAASRAQATFRTRTWRICWRR
jgi:hypothetical protein